MKIVFCTGTTLNSGGVEKVLSQRTEYLIEKCNCEVYIITTENTSQRYKDMVPLFSMSEKIKVIDLGINYTDIFSKANDNFLSNKKRGILLRYKKMKHYIKLKKEINRIKPDIITSMGDYSRNLIYKLPYSCKKILEYHFTKNFYFESTSHVGQIKKFLIKNRNKMERKLVQKYDEFIVLTEEDRKAWNIPKVKVIGNPLSFIPNNIAKLENKKVISVGRLSHEKGFDILINIWNKINHFYPEWKLEIYGEGSLRKNLQNQIEELQLQEKIKLMGLTKKIEEKFLESSIYVMTSRTEGFGMVLAEAGICGLPLVAFEAGGGPKELVENNLNGFLCKPNEVDELSERIIELIKSEELRKKFGRNSREKMQTFKLEDIMTKWKEIYCIDDNKKLS